MTIRQKKLHKKTRIRKHSIFILLVIILLIIFAFIKLSADNENTAGSYVANRSDKPGWELTLVNKWNPVPDDYEISLVQVPGGEKVDERIYKPLMDMLKDAENDGLDPVIASGYRTDKEQERLFDKKVSEYCNQGYSEKDAYELANMWVSVPGYSEHQLGLAVDINGSFYDIFLWLQENSYKYGFIFRYQGSKTDITGAAEEVWHYRYVGIEAAAEMYEQDLCLEEYVEQNIS